MDADLLKVLKAMAVAAAAGGSVASLAGLINYIRANKLREQGNSEWDDDTLYVYKKQASDELLKQAGIFKGIASQLAKIPGGLRALNTWAGKNTGKAVGGGIGLTALGTYIHKLFTQDEKFNGWTAGWEIPAIPAAFIGSYLLANWLNNRKLRSDALDDLDAALNVFVDQSGYNSMMKKKADIVDSIGGIGAGLALLLALGSGYATDQYLESNWPIDKPKPLSKPKKIRVIDSAKAEEILKQQEMDELLQQAELVDKKASDNGLELAARLLCTMDKHAAVVSDIVHAVAAGRAQEFQKAVDDMGFESAVDIVKGASYNKVPEDIAQLAVQYCIKEAGFSPQFKLAVAAEYTALHPEFCKEAALQSYPCQLFLLAFTDDAADAIRYDLASSIGGAEFTEKLAAEQDDLDLGQAYLNVFLKYAASPVLDNSDQQSTDIQGIGTQTASSKPAGKIKQESQQYANALQNPEDNVAADPIDQVLQQPTQERKVGLEQEAGAPASDLVASAPSSVLQTS